MAGFGENDQVINKTDSSGLLKSKTDSTHEHPLVEGSPLWRTTIGTSTYSLTKTDLPHKSNDLPFTSLPYCCNDKSSVVRGIFLIYAPDILILKIKTNKQTLRYVTGITGDVMVYEPAGGIASLPLLQ